MIYNIIFQAPDGHTKISSWNDCVSMYSFRRTHSLDTLGHRFLQRIGILDSCQADESVILPWIDNPIRCLFVFEDASLSVTHFQFLGWPDHDVPVMATGLLEFHHKVRSYDRTASGPLLVHCRCARRGVWWSQFIIIKCNVFSHNVCSFDESNLLDD